MAGEPLAPLWLSKSPVAFICCVGRAGFVVSASVRAQLGSLARLKPLSQYAVRTCFAFPSELWQAPSRSINSFERHPAEIVSPPSLSPALPNPLLQFLSQTFLKPRFTVRRYRSQLILISCLCSLRDMPLNLAFRLRALCVQSVNTARGTLLLIKTTST